MTRKQVWHGHSTVFTTVHADTPEDALRRLDEYTAEAERQRHEAARRSRGWRRYLRREKSRTR